MFWIKNILSQPICLLSHWRMKRLTDHQHLMNFDNHSNNSWSDWSRIELLIQFEFTNWTSIAYHLLSWCLLICTICMQKNRLYYLQYEVKTSFFLKEHMLFNWTVSQQLNVQLKNISAIKRPTKNAKLYLALELLHDQTHCWRVYSISSNWVWYIRSSLGGT